MKKLASGVKKSAARKTAGANPKPPVARRTPSGWRSALERNLRAQGYSSAEARELVEIAAS
ncbi:MAG TPA: hypothetical protein VMR62_22590 [Bryobacteraceae bacterium]|jgi:hypothetical protein|nr:hypothetical protein [Bryobacteraceae bacterium]